MSTDATTTENKVEITRGVTLTKEIALSIQNHILNGVAYSFRNDKTIRLSDLNLVFSASTYDNWINRENIVPDTNKTLKQIVADARQKRQEIQRRKQNEAVIEKSRKAIEALIDMPIHNTSVMRTMKRNKEGVMREVQRTTIKDISAPLVHAKVKGLTFALERLDPDYAKKDEVKHAHVVFSLADLRKHQELKRNESTTQGTQTQ